MTPEGWVQRTLGSICEGPGAYGANVPKRSFDPSLPRYVRITDLGGDGSLRTDGVVSIARRDAAPYMLMPGDLLFARSGATVGKTYLYMEQDGPCAYAGYLIRFRPKESKVAPRFLKYYVQSPLYWAWITKYQRAMAQPNINAREYESLPVLLPPLPEQRQIATILTSVDDAIQATQAVIDQTRRVKQGLLQQLLTRGIGHTRFKMTEVGQVPEDWEVFRIGDLADVKGGKRMPKGRPFADAKTLHPYIRVCDLLEGSVRTSELKYVLPEDRDAIKRYTISSDDVYISIAGTLGLVGLVPGELDGAQLTENAAKICIRDRGRLSKHYLVAVMSADAVRLQIGQAKGVGGGVPKLALFRIESIQIPLPPREEQDSIVAALSSIEASLRRLGDEFGGLLVLKSALMQDLLTGRVRVKVPA
jgi:type I restriction enzyme, S subunit